VKKRLLILIAVATVLVALPTVAFGDSARSAANTTTFNDSIGEDAMGPDITTVVISNDNAGFITIKLNISNRPALTPDMLIIIFMDSDSNSSTGDPQLLGADDVIQLLPGAVGLFHWNGTDFTTSPTQSSLTYLYDATGATIRIKAADLGNTKAFKFAAFVYSGVTTDPQGNLSFDSAHLDGAPDPGHGFFTYQVLTKLVLGVTQFTTAPKPAKAGKTFSASFAATENDTSAPVQTGTVACAATIALKRIVATAHVLTNGVATCVWRIPKTAKGKTIRGTITLTVKGVSVKRTFAVRIV
jgi:hypothetical protein